MKPRLVMFDMAGTTVFDRGGVARVMSGVLEEFGAKLNPGSFTPLMGTPTINAIKQGFKRAFDTRWEDNDFIAQASERLDERLIEHFETQATEVPGALATMDLLKQNGIFIVLDTGFNRRVADAVLNKLKWSGGIIDYTITSSEVNRAKPHPDMVFEIMKRFAVDNPAHVAKVGDTPNDLLMGNISGCGWNIGVTEGSHVREALIPYPHTHLVMNIKDCPGIFLED